MKLNFYLVGTLIACATLTGCNSNKSGNNATETSADTTQVASDMHTAENSLDYFGEYKGTIPAADCPGINATLVLNNDKTFTLNYIYIERKGSDYNDSGTFSVEGNIVTATSKDGGKSYYKLEEGKVVMLNADKEPATGELADAYTLLKQ